MTSPAGRWPIRWRATRQRRLPLCGESPRRQRRGPSMSWRIFSRSLIMKAVISARRRGTGSITPSRYAGRNLPSMKRSSSPILPSTASCATACSGRRRSCSVFALSSDSIFRFIIRTCRYGKLSTLTERVLCCSMATTSPGIAKAAGRGWACLLNNPPCVRSIR